MALEPVPVELKVTMAFWYWIATAMAQSILAVSCFGVDTLKSNDALAVHGFDALSDLDSNGDHVFNQSDDEFAHLQVWRDFNQNGISTPNELFSLSELGIISFNLNAVTQNVNLGNGNVQTAAAAHLMVDGCVGCST